MLQAEEIAAALARIEAQGASTHHRLDELREDLLRHVQEDEVRFEKVNGRITRGAVRQGWILGLGVGAMAVLNWAKDHLTF